MLAILARQTLSSVSLRSIIEGNWSVSRKCVDETGVDERWTLEIRKSGDQLEFSHGGSRYSIIFDNKDLKFAVRSGNLSVDFDFSKSRQPFLSATAYISQKPVHCSIASLNHIHCVDSAPAVYDFVRASKSHELILRKAAFALLIVASIVISALLLSKFCGRGVSATEKVKRD